MALRYSSTKNGQSLGVVFIYLLSKGIAQGRVTRLETREMIWHQIEHHLPQDFTAYVNQQPATSLLFRFFDSHYWRPSTLLPIPPLDQLGDLSRIEKLSVGKAQGRSKRSC